MHKAQVTPLIGLPQLDGWASITSDGSGSTVWSLAVSGSHASNVGRDVVDTLQSEQITTGAELYSITQKILTDAAHKECRLACAAVLFTEETSVFCSYWAGVTLRRGDKVGSILTPEAKLQIREGKYQVGDLYILATQQAQEHFLDEVRQKINQGYESDTIVTSIAPGLHLQEATSLSAMAFVSLQPVTSESAHTSKAAEAAGIAAASTRRALQDQSKQEISGTQSSAQPQESHESLEAQALESDTHVEPLTASAVLGSGDEDPERPILSTSEESLVARSLLSVKQASSKLADAKIDQKARSVAGAIGSGLVSLGGTVSSGATVAVTAGQAFAAHIKHMVASRRSQSVSSSGGVVSSASTASAGSAFQSQHTSAKRALSPVHAARRMFSRDVYVGGSSSGIMWRLVGGGLVLAIIVTAWFFWRQQRLTQRAQVLERLQPLEQQLEQAQSIADASPVTAREQVADAIAQLEALRVELGSRAPGSALVSQQLEEAQALAGAISGTEERNELPVFVDARIQQPDILFTQAGFADGQAFLYDTGTSTIVTVDLSDASLESIQVDDIAEVRDISLGFPGETIWILADGILSIDPTTQTSIAREIDQDDVTTDAQLISSFANSLYIFNPEARTIYRYPPADEGFEEAVRWLRAGQDLNFEAVTDMVIDGSIWLATRDGEIMQLQSGVRQDFEVQGLAQPFTSRLLLFASEDGENVYVLEPERQRVVVLSKDGTFIKEVVSQSLATANNLVVDESQNKGFAISGSILYEVGL